MMRWAWHQPDHMQMQIICTSLQTDNHASTSPLSLFTGRMSFLLLNQQRQSTEGLSIIVQWKEVWLATVVYRYCDCTGHCPMVSSVSLVVVCVCSDDEEVVLWCDATVWLYWQGGCRVRN